LLLVIKTGEAAALSLLKFLPLGGALICDKSPKMSFVQFGSKGHELKFYLFVSSTFPPQRNLGP